MKVLVLAGGYDQIGLINELKIRGNEVILADYFENPPAKKVADKHYQISTLDEAAVKDVAIKEQVDLITTACTDQALLTVAKVSEELGLPTYISYEKALAVTNKKYMKDIFIRESIPTAKSRTYSQMESFEKEVDEIGYPSVVKPCDCNSSKGVVKVENKEELVAAAKAAFALSRSHLIIVEDFIEGEEVSIDVWADNEGAKVLSVSQTEKIEGSKDSFTIFKSKYPVQMSENLKRKIAEVAGQIANGFGLENCPILIQAIIYGDHVSVIEFSARMGGGTKYKLIEYMSGVNIMKVYVNRILGDVSQIVSPIPSEKNIELNYVYANNGTFTDLVNYEECLKSGEIEAYYQYKESGAVIDKARTSSDRVAGFLLLADNLQEINEKRDHVLQKLDVLDEHGNSMMIKSIYGGKFHE